MNNDRKHTEFCNLFGCPVGSIQVVGKLRGLSVAVNQFRHSQSLSIGCSDLFLEAHVRWVSFGLNNRKYRFMTVYNQMQTQIISYREEYEALTT